MIVEDHCQFSIGDEIRVTDAKLGDVECGRGRRGGGEGRVGRLLVIPHNMGPRWSRQAHIGGAKVNERHIIEAPCSELLLNNTKKQHERKLKFALIRANAASNCNMYAREQELDTHVEAISFQQQLV